MRSILLALLLIGIPMAASAQEHVTIANKIPYLNDDVGRTEVREQCDWDTQMSSYIVSYGDGLVSATDQDLSKVSGAVLVITIDDVHAAGGGGFSGPKWAIIRGELRNGGQVLGTFKFRRVSGHGFTACGALDKIARALAGNVTQWLRSEHPVVDDSGNQNQTPPADSTQ